MEDGPRNVDNESNLSIALSLSLFFALCLFIVHCIALCCIAFTVSVLSRHTLFPSSLLFSSLSGVPSALNLRSI